MTGKKPVIGITGGIASGKTLVARLLGELGAGVIQADELNHLVLHRDAVRRQIQDWWGQDLYDAEGRLHRRKLADIVFHDPRQKERLESLTHPLVLEECEAMTRRFEADPTIGAIVLDTPLLFEVGQDARCDAILFVETAEDIRAERARRHRGWDHQELSRRENLQNPLDKKKLRSDHIIVNNSDIEALRQRVRTVYQQVTSK